MNITNALIVAAGYLVVITTSGPVVRYFIGGAGKSRPADEKINLGAIIGKCENILTVTLILADALTGLALIFTAKSIVRSEDMKRDPRFYLGGTLVNFTYSVVMGFLIRLILAAAVHSSS
jgi:hypothetical protein